jgi:hypothetical protein
MIGRCLLKSSTRWGLIAILLGAGAIRLALMVPAIGRLEDPDNYLILATSLSDGDGFAMMKRLTAFRPPLYPLLLTPFVQALGGHVAWGVGALHLVLGLATVGLTAVAARRWGFSDSQVLIVSAIVAFDPVLVAQGRMVMSETLGAFLVAATLAALTVEGWPGALIGGLGFGLGTLCRPSLLPAAALAAAGSVVFGSSSLPKRVAYAALLSGATVAALGPWAYRNFRLFGEPVWTTTHGGYTLALANNPVYYDEVVNGPPGAVWSGPGQARWFDESHRAMTGLSEPGADRRMVWAALTTIQERPRDFIRATLARLGRFWGVAPAGAVYPRPLRLASTLWTVPLWGALALGLARRALWCWPRVSAPAIVLALTLVHALFWTDLRMRAPVVPAIALIAAGAFPIPRERTG